MTTTPTFSRPHSDDFFSHTERLVPMGIGSVGRLRDRRVVLSGAQGAHLHDIDGNEFVDLVMGLGPIVVGHGEAQVNDAVVAAIGQTVILGAESPTMLDVARKIVDRIPSAEHVIFSNSGSEADQAALRIARATTGRSKILKFEGHYHGWLDPMFVNANGVEPSSDPDPEISLIPNCEGQIDASGALVVTRWNDRDAFDTILERHGDDLAAVIMEPIPFNFGAFLPHPGYLEHVRQRCTERGIVLIFDEVVSGFRVGPAGAQGLLGVTPDMSVFAKALGNGYPVSMVVGTSWAMASAVEERVRHSGTYNANPISMAAANATLDMMDSLPDLHERLESLGSQLQSAIEMAAVRHEVPLQVNRVGSALQLFWGATGDLRSYASCSTSDRARIAWLGERMLACGVHMTPRGLLYLCYRHDESDIAAIAAALDTCLSELVR